MAGIGKKVPVLVSERVARVFDKLSKAALIDLCAYLIRRAEGADIGDWELVEKLGHEYLPPVLRERGDRGPNLGLYWGGAGPHWDASVTALVHLERRRTMAKHTPGPWGLYQRMDGAVYLATPNRGHLIVMDFVRRGMNSAQARFARWEGDERGNMGGIMVPTDKMEVLEHPDAKLIAAAPDLLHVCKYLLAAIKEPFLQSGSPEDPPEYATAEDDNLARLLFEAKKIIANVE